MTPRPTHGIRTALLALPLALVTACGTGDTDADDKDGQPKTTPVKFKLRVENVAPFTQLKSGVFTTRVGGTAPGPLAPGGAYEFSFSAGRGHRLTFATMFGQSNDWVFTTAPGGIALYENGEPVSGDMTSQVFLYDVGSELDEEPAIGPHTGPNQGSSVDGPGAPDPVRSVRRIGSTVRLANGNQFTVPRVSSMIRLTLTPRGNQVFTARIENVSVDGQTLQTSQGGRNVRFSPGVWVLSTGGEPLFTEGRPDRGQGLEDIAEYGRLDPLVASLRPLTGIATWLSAGVLVVHKDRAPLFTLGEQDRGLGLERLAEDGLADGVATTLKGSTTGDISKVAVFDTPVGREDEGAIAPGRAYEIDFEAVPGDRLSLVTMFGWSNDWFFGSPEAGIQLFDGNRPLYGPITGDLRLYDLGTELSEEPAVGPNTSPQQPAPDTGIADPDSRVREVTPVEYPVPVSNHLKITLEEASEE